MSYPPYSTAPDSKISSCVIALLSGMEMGNRRFAVAHSPIIIGIIGLALAMRDDSRSLNLNVSSCFISHRQIRREEMEASSKSIILRALLQL